MFVFVYDVGVFVIFYVGEMVFEMVFVDRLILVDNVIVGVLVYLCVGG